MSRLLVRALKDFDAAVPSLQKSSQKAQASHFAGWRCFQLEKPVGDLTSEFL